MLFNNTNMRTAMAYTNAVGDKVYPVIVDIKKGIKSTEEILFVSSDINTGILSVAFIQGNDTYNVAGAEVVCSVMRPDASTLDIPCTVIENNIVEVPLGVNGTSQDGIYSFDFKVFKGGNKVVGTPIMNYSVSLSISNDNTVLEDDRLPVLTMLITQVTELKDEARESINQANTATEATKVATANAIEATNNVNAVINTANQKMVDVDNAKNEMTATVTNKVNEVEGRFNALTASQQQSSEVIDARDGEVSLKARLDRDIEKAKQVYVNVEGSHISTDSSSGYLKDVEILGNTIQDASNLADIRSVGDKVEGQELYEIPVLSCGKNLFDKTKCVKGVIGANGVISTNNEWNVSDFIKVRPNMQLVKTILADMCAFDINKNPIGIIANGTTIFTIPANCYYIRCNVDNVSLGTYQLEEGTVATPYEPYVEDKLTILSPVQLEKVGNVADRLIEKDGVWGVEKNVETYHLKDFTQSNYDNFACRTVLPKFGIVPNNHTTVPFYTNLGYMHTNINYQWNNRGIDSIAVSRATISGQFEYVCDVTSENYVYNDVVKMIKDNDVWIKYALLESQFIPLPHDQQIKLRTFANKTNISFLTEIEGTIKAQVPKSIGATVNTHTEQISNLNKELDKIKKLEESTVSTVETESDFTTVEATSNGYFEDVKLEGKTLVNLVNAPRVTLTTTSSYQQLSNGRYFLIPQDTSKTYTIIILGSFEGTIYLKDNNANNVANINKPITLYTPKLQGNTWFQLLSDTTVGRRYDFEVVILEGDHTQNPPSFFEGLKSVGEDTDEVSVVSLDTTEDIKYHNDVYFSTSAVQYSFNPRITKNKYIYNNSDKPIEISLYVNNSWSKDIPIKPYECTFVECPANGSFNVIRFTKQAGWELTTQDINNIVLMSDHPIKVDKKRLLYYNNETQTWEKPILREWDSIEKHADGKYYYHQRSGEVVLNGSEKWVYSADSTRVNTSCFTLEINNCVHTGDAKTGIAICDKVNSGKFIDVIEKRDIEGLSADYGKIFLCILKSKLSTQDVQGFKQWLQANNVTVVYQLAQEKVYECTNIDLITYANETNYIVESGAIAPKTILKVHNNISNVVKILQEKVSLLENKFIEGLKQVLAGDMYSLAELLYPEDFEEVKTENNIMLLPLE